MPGDYDVDAYDVHVLAGAVKLFFRELREPLIPATLLDQFISASRQYMLQHSLIYSSAY